ncbi:MAG: hypothetical protein Alpg2KO_27590 [Alphaproteobacteria bacterium]
MSKTTDIVNSSEAAGWSSRVFARVLTKMETPMQIFGETVPPEEAAATDRLYPLFMLEACSVAEAIFGEPTPPPIAGDPESRLGVRVTGLPEMPSSIIMACLTEAAYSVMKDDQISLDPLMARWQPKLEELKLVSAPASTRTDD